MILPRLDLYLGLVRTQTNLLGISIRGCELCLWETCNFFAICTHICIWIWICIWFCIFISIRGWELCLRETCNSFAICRPSLWTSLFEQCAVIKTTFAFLFIFVLIIVFEFVSVFEYVFVCLFAIGCRFPLFELPCLCNALQLKPPVTFSIPTFVSDYFTKTNFFSGLDISCQIFQFHVQEFGKQTRIYGA